MERAKLSPKREGLYDPQFEHDACGVGFIADINGQKSHKTVEDALKILETRSQTGDGNDDVAAIGGQRAYTHIDRSRAKIASETGYDEKEEARLIAALREESVRRTGSGS